MVHFGFSYVGLIYLTMLFVPNIIWAKNKPADYENHVQKENKVLLFLERIGEGLTSVCALIFSDLNIRVETVWSLWLLFSFLLMIFYELYWIRYFKSPKTMADMYSGFAGFPVAGASLPCAAFFMLGIYGSNIFLIFSSIILSVGHIGIHLMHRNAVVEKTKSKKILRILRMILLIPVVAGLVLTIVAVAGRNINWFRNPIDTSKGINESVYVPIGGQDLYLLIRGRDVHNPVILYIHGGPAGPDSLISPVFTDPLIDDYTVVCWDQRGCGRSYFRNAGQDPENLTVNFGQAVKDTDEVVDYIRTRFNKEKVILMCHSYGTVVGTNYIQEHSGKVAAYVGLGQFVNCRESDRLAYEDALTVARSRGEDTSDLEKTYQDYLGGDSIVEYMALRNATTKYHKAKNKANTPLLALFSPYTGVNDIRWVLKQIDLVKYQELERDLFNTTYYYDVYERSLEFDVPMLFISGEKDYVCNCQLTRKFCDDLTAPRKEFYEVEGGGHTPHYETPEIVAEKVLNFLK